MAINERGGIDAVNLKVAEQYINEFGNLAKTNNTVILPTNLSDLAGMVVTVTSVLKPRKCQDNQVLHKDKGASEKTSK